MHGESKDERIRLRVTPSTKERARKWARRRGVSLSAYVLTAVEKQMDEDLMSDIDSELDN